MNAILILILLTSQVGAADQSDSQQQQPAAVDEKQATDLPASVSEPQPSSNEQQKEDLKADHTWKWILGIFFTAIISPLVVKLAEAKLTSDPVKEKTGRLKSLIELSALRKAHGLPDDPRVRALIDEQSDALGKESTGKQEVLDATISGLIADLSIRLLKSLFDSCQQLEMLQESDCKSNTLAAVLDLTQLELLRSSHAVTSMGVPLTFRSIQKEDLTRYIERIRERTEPLGSIAMKHAAELGTTPEAVQEFVLQLQEAVRAPSVDTSEADQLRGDQGE